MGEFLNADEYVEGARFSLQLSFRKPSSGNNIYYPIGGVWNLASHPFGKDMIMLADKVFAGAEKHNLWVNLTVTGMTDTDCLSQRCFQGEEEPRSFLWHETPYVCGVDCRTMHGNQCEECEESTKCKPGNDQYYPGDDYPSNLGEKENLKILESMVFSSDPIPIPGSLRGKNANLPANVLKEQARDNPTLAFLRAYSIYCRGFGNRFASSSLLNQKHGVKIDIDVSPEDCERDYANVSPADRGQPVRRAAAIKVEVFCKQPNEKVMVAPDLLDLCGFDKQR